ncbi:protein SPMIP2 [Pseudophryne corroboree]|uniref:protein SPMIP2 n=1 Tax=Pseudophryne corroboree TaxID=495146 RepID=UPI003081A81D
MQPKYDGKLSTSGAGYPLHESGKRMLYTGPNYVRDYRAKLPDCITYIGEGTASAERTSEVDYLCRAAPGTPAPLPKNSYVGGIGWGVSAFSMINRDQLCSGHQIKIGDFRQACEDKIAHQYQNPWHPLPQILDAQGFGSRATLAWDQDRYDDYFFTKGRWTSLLEQNSTPSPVPSYPAKGENKKSDNSEVWHALCT